MIEGSEMDELFQNDVQDYYKGMAKKVVHVCAYLSLFLA